MSEEIFETPTAQLDALDRVYRRWARARLRSGRLVGFILEAADGHAAASGCVWLMPVQPHARWRGLAVPYLMSMYTEKGYRGKGYATRITREAIQWSRAHGYSVIFLHASPFGRGIYEREGFSAAPEMRLFLDEHSSASRERTRRGGVRGSKGRRPH